MVNERIKKEITDYIKNVRELSTEPAKSHRFSLLLNNLFGVKPEFIENYVSGIEKFVKTKEKDHVIKGKIDNLFGNLVIEFENHLEKTRSEAEEQLRRYIYILWKEEPQFSKTPFLGIATDGEKFVVYSPFTLFEEISSPEDVLLTIIDEVYFPNMEPYEIYFWLDRYFLRKTVLNPTTENIVKDFGVKSHAFHSTFQDIYTLWERVKNNPNFSVLFESWEKYLRIVYGKAEFEDALFCRHTYLATLAKLMAWIKLEGGKIKDKEVGEVLAGRYFKSRGIDNFLEEDFFSWIAREEVKDQFFLVVRKLLSLLSRYNIGTLSEDVLKSLYQELVDPETRHNLGEFYTPDWLAHLMAQKLVEENPTASFLDPACGSGTFLYFVIQEKKKQLPENTETLKHILGSVFGIDIHPLAVIIAKTNYILALGELLKQRKERISLPVYLADSINLPQKVKKTFWEEYNGYKVSLQGEDVYISEKLFKDPTLYDRAVDVAGEFAKEMAGQKVNATQFRSFFLSRMPSIEDEKLIESLFFLSEKLKEFIEKGRDTIWVFVLKNMYKPLFLRGKFDFIIGNPPWLVFRDAEIEYQKFLRKKVVKKYDLVKDAKLITHIEVGILFLYLTAELYLKDNGKIAFVLPRSIFSADQHAKVREGKVLLPVKIKEVWDLDNVSPLFNIPACVVFGNKEKGKQFYPIPSKIISGTLYKKNSSKEEALENLKFVDSSIYLNIRGGRSFWTHEDSQLSIKKGKSPYYKAFSQGATIVPRKFWFVKLEVSPVGIDPNLPYIRSHAERTKPPWDKVELAGNIESKFLFRTILSSDLLPFGYLKSSLIVSPLEFTHGRLNLLTKEMAQKRGFLKLANWLEKVEKEWSLGQGKKKKMSAVKWLNYRNKLINQIPIGKIIVLYNTSGTHLVSAVVESPELEIKINGQIIKINGFVAESTTYYAYPHSAEEAYFLSAFLNSPFVDEILKPLQSKGQQGERHIHKKVLEFPIPRFDPSSESHVRLSQIGKIASQKINAWVSKRGYGEIKSIGAIRQRARKLLKKQLEEIDKIVKDILLEK